MGNEELKRTFRTNARCPRCGRRLHTTDVFEYGFVCLYCDENMYVFEVRDLDSAFLKIRISMPAEVYERMEEKLLKIVETYACDFLSHDNDCNIMDIGWDVYKDSYVSPHLPSDKLLYQVTDQLEQLVRETFASTSSTIKRKDIQKQPKCLSAKIFPKARF